MSLKFSELNHPYYTIAFYFHIDKKSSVAKLIYSWVIKCDESHEHWFKKDLNKELMVVIGLLTAKSVEVLLENITNGKIFKESIKSVEAKFDSKMKLPEEIYEWKLNSKSYVYRPVCIFEANEENGDENIFISPSHYCPKQPSIVS